MSAGLIDPMVEALGSWEGLGVSTGTCAGESVGLGAGEGSGGLVSTVKVTVLSVSEPSILEVLDASVKAPLATEITPLAVLLVSGVKVAV